MTKNKGIKYYAFIFGVATVGIFLYVTVLAVRDGGYSPAFWFLLMVLPITFTLFVFVFDKVFDFIFPKKKKQSSEEEEFYVFLAKVSDIIDEEPRFSIEDRRRLRDDKYFSKAIHQVYVILKFGETKDLTYDYLSKKFKKDSKEFIAINNVIQNINTFSKNS